jgi:hypothetical protein
MTLSNQRRLAWYRVPELWLFMLLIAATVIGTFSMMATALRQPDVHINVPNDVPRPNRIPPIWPATPAADAPTKPGDPMPPRP